MCYAHEAKEKSNLYKWEYGADLEVSREEKNKDLGLPEFFIAFPNSILGEGLDTIGFLE